MRTACSASRGHQGWTGGNGRRYRLDFGMSPVMLTGDIRKSARSFEMELEMEMKSVFGIGFEEWNENVFEE